VDLPSPEFPLSRRDKVLMSLGPIAALVVAIVALLAFGGWQTTAFFAGAVAGNFLGAGKLVIFMGAVDGAPLGVWAIACLVVLSDAGTALFMLANIHHVDRLPVVGPTLARSHAAGMRILRANRWLRRLTGVGVALWVAFPFQGTGAVLGVVLARLVGLSRLGTLVAITLGASAGAFPLALLGRVAQRHIQQLAERPALGLATLATCILATVVLGRWLTGRAPAESEPVVSPSSGSSQR
jgi:hypothetical protein